MKYSQTEVDIYNKEIMPLINKIIEVKGTLEMVRVSPDGKLSYSNELKLKTIECLYREYKLIMKNYNLSRGDVIRLGNYVDRLAVNK